MALRCKPGDIALVVRAEHLHNIGLIVKVLGPYPGGDIELPGRGFLWEVECKQLQMWMMNGQVRWRHRGPVPDDYLLPLRDKATEHDPAQAAAPMPRKQMRAQPPAR
jgi:hypothetical protein